VIDLFRKRFVNRDDCFPQQYYNSNGGYSVIREKLTDDIIREHLKGKRTIGLYSSITSTTKWLCVDIDDLNEIAVREVQNHVRRFKISYLTEFSGKKGYHIWVFFDRPYPNKIARALASAFSFDHEVFPKQNNIAPSKLGNLVKAPLGKHQVSGKWCLFLDKNLEREKDQYSILAKAQTINPIKTLQQEMPDIWAKTNRKISNDNKVNNSFSPSRFPIIKDCVQQAILTGTVNGARNQTGHIIASELNLLGLPKDQTEIILNTIWNKNNKPPLDENEIKLLTNSAYSDPQYVYGCKENSLLRKYLNCVGKENCLFLAVLKLNRRK